MLQLLHVMLLTLALSRSSVAFVSFGGHESSHVSISAKAILRKVTETCRAVAVTSKHDFNPTGSSAEELVQACLGPTATGDVSAAKFRSAQQEIYIQNGQVDYDLAESAPHHFDSEAFLEGRALITEGVAAIKMNVLNKNYQAARKTLGRVLHTLQDFYSHSNWVELGYTKPYINLIRPDLPLENLADYNTATCSDCASGICDNPILPNILKDKKLTSGYIGINSAVKPAGKCSHGGSSDLTSTVVPRGGINKDKLRSTNDALHPAAVKLAISASLELLEDIRGAAGDVNFLRMMGIARSSVVCFVIDTTGSMGDDINEARRIVFQIIDSKKGTQDEPSEYIFVPFNDPDFGPTVRTADAEEIKMEISKLHPHGGGDRPEMCLSGLQLALTSAPDSSHIYVFTDADAKDIALKDTIIALIRSTKSTVSFFMTAVNLRRRRRRSAKTLIDDYRELALASGGQAIHVSKKNLPQATAVILDTSTSALVTVVQHAVNSGDHTFPFMLDESLKNITLYITGTSVTFTVTNPAGVTQRHDEAAGKLGTISTVGNLWRVSLNADKQSGTWKISIQSSSPYTLKVTGQNTITFIYEFVQSFQGAHPGLAPISGRPQAGQPVSLLLSVMGRKGYTSVTVGGVDLVSASGEVLSNSTMRDMGNGDILVTVDAVPKGEFLVRLKGIDFVSNSTFQRQSTTQMSVSKVSIQAVVDRSVEPGQTLLLPFSVITKGPGGKFSINIRNDRGFTMKFPESLALTTGQYTNASLTIQPPAGTPSGTDVTLTIEAKSSDSVDSNYAVLRLSVITKITDFVQPQCKVVLVEADDCPKDASQCEHFHWKLSANLTDGNGTGIETMTLRQGDGVLSYTSLSDSFMQVAYNASCCSQVVELIAVDKVGNVGKCYHSIARSSGPPSATLSPPLWLYLLVTFMFMP